MPISYLQNSNNINYRLIKNNNQTINFLYLQKLINILIGDMKSNEAVYDVIRFLNRKISLLELKDSLRKFNIYLNHDRYLEYCNNLYIITSLSTLFKEIFVNGWSCLYYGDSKEKAFQKLLTLKNYSYTDKIDENLFNSNVEIDNYSSCVDINKIEPLTADKNHYTMLIAIRFIISDSHLLKQILFHKDKIIRNTFKTLYCNLLFNNVTEIPIASIIGRIIRYLKLNVGLFDVYDVLGKLQIKNAKMLRNYNNRIYYSYNLFYKLYLAKDDSRLINEIITNIPEGVSNLEFEELRTLILSSETYENLVKDKSSVIEFIDALVNDTNLTLFKNFLNTNIFKQAYKSRDSIWVDSRVVDLPHNFDLENSNINNLIASDNNILIHMFRKNNNWYMLKNNQKYIIRKINQCISRYKILSFGFYPEKKLSGKNKTVLVTNEHFGEVVVPYSQKSEFDKEDELFQYKIELEKTQDITDLNKHISIQKKINGEDININRVNVKRRFSIDNTLNGNIRIPYVMFSDYIKIIKDSLILNFHHNLTIEEIRHIKEIIMTDLITKFVTLLMVLRKYRINHNDLHSNNLKISLKNEFYHNTTIFKIDAIKAFDWGKLRIKDQFSIDQDLKLAYNDWKFKDLFKYDGWRQIYVFLSRSYSGVISDFDEFYRKTPLAYIYSICYKEESNIYKQFKQRDLNRMLACIMKIIRANIINDFNNLNHYRTMC